MPALAARSHAERARRPDKDRAVAEDDDLRRRALDRPTKEAAFRAHLLVYCLVNAGGSASGP